jgi:peptidoglycan-associated lipoprotein
MYKKWQWLAIASITVAMLVVATGCSKTKTKTDEGMVTPQPVVEPTARETMEPGMAMAEESLESPPKARSGSPLVLEGRTSAPLLPIYFDFDKSNIREDQRSRVEENGVYLTANTGVAVRIEGNCDERGTNEYNLALGERRALSAKKYLINLGVAGSRIDTLSFGEDSPLVRGHDEVAWAQNRRADFVILD